MSTTPTQPEESMSADQVGTPATESQFNVAMSRIDDLEEKVEKQAELIQQQQELIEQQQETIEQLEDDVEFNTEKGFDLEDLLTGEFSIGIAEDEVEEHGGVLDQLEDLRKGNLNGAVADLEDDIVEEQKQRSIVESRLRKQINVVAEKSGVDITESDLVGEDKITRVMRDGPQAVESSVYPVHERACEVLRNVDRWGTITTDKFGKRFVLNSPTVSERLEDRRDEKLSTTEVKRVFSKIEDWAQDSPRRVSTKFGGDVNKLLLSLDHEEN